MKQMFRAVVTVLFVGGWSLAGSALHVIRTPSNVAVVPKDRLTFHDTWVDTRKWTLSDDQTHAAVVARLVHLGRADLLAHTLPAGADAPVVLAAIAAQQPVPGVATSTTANAAMQNAGTVVKNAEGQLKTVVDLAKTQASKM